MSSLTVLHTETHAHCTVNLVIDPDPSSPREWDQVGRMVCWHRNYRLGDEQPSEDAAAYLLDLLTKAGEAAFVDGLEARYDAIGDKLTADKSLGYGSPAYCRAFDEAEKPILAEREALLAKHYTILPLYLYDHSGITMKAAPFGCGWDSGKVGFIFVSLRKAADEASLFRAKEATATWDSLVKWGKHDKERITLRQYALNLLNGEVETYDQFLTGEVYGYQVTHDETGEEDSCWGFYQNERVDAKDSYVLAQAREAAEGLERNAAKEREERAHWEARDTVTS